MKSTRISAGPVTSGPVPWTHSMSVATAHAGDALLGAEAAALFRKSATARR